MKLEQKIKYTIWDFIFYSNFFMGLMSIALNVETSLKANLGLNQWDYYSFIGAATVLFYLFAYNVPKQFNHSENPRTQFYIDFRQPILWFKRVLWLILIISGSSIVVKSYTSILRLEVIHFLILGLTFLLATSYYDWKFGFSLRRFTWLKPILIAWTWAITTVYLPVLFFQLENQIHFNADIRFYVHFIEIFMFFIVNAIMFDMKDFADDTNRGVKTFVVKYGIHFMLYKVILPLICLGFICTFLFGLLMNFNGLQHFCTLFPLVLMGIFALRINQNRPILYYLIAIDGIIALKAVLGIIGEIF